MVTVAETPGPGPQGMRSRRWPARLGFVPAGLAIVSLAAAYFFLPPASR